MGICTSPFPYVRVPNTIPRSRSCSAPLVISLAEAVSPFTITTRGITVSSGSTCVWYAFEACFSLPRLSTTVMPFGSHRFRISTASCSDPPPLPRRSSISEVAPWRFRSISALLTSFEHPSVKAFRLM